MSTATLMNTCSVCGAEESLDALLLRMIDDEQVRRLIADVVTASLPLGGLVIRYLRLHKPSKQKLRMGTVEKLLAELVPDMQRGVIERTGRSWAVGIDTWREALQAVFDANAKGTLTVPLLGNGYLYQVLMRLADNAEAVQEKQVDENRRQRATLGNSQSFQSIDPLRGAVDPLTARGTEPPPIPAAPTFPTHPRVESPTVRRFKAELAEKKGAAV